LLLTLCPFFLAAQKASNVRSTQLESVASNNGFLWVFQVWGVVAVSGLTCAFAWFLVVSLEEFNDQDSPHYVENPIAIAVTGAVIGLGIGATFMNMLGRVADTIVFCFTRQTSSRPSHELAVLRNVPPAFQRYLAGSGTGSATGEDFVYTQLPTTTRKGFPP